MRLYEIIMIVVSGLIAISLIALTIIAIHWIGKKQKRSALVDGRFSYETKRLIWRVTNRSLCDITVVEIGIRAGGETASFRPLYFGPDGGINMLPCLITPGGVASYRFDVDKFLFTPEEIENFADLNPNIQFYVKDAMGRAYIKDSGVSYSHYCANMNIK